MASLGLSLVISTIGPKGCAAGRIITRGLATLPEPRLQPHQLHVLVNSHNEEKLQVVGEVLQDANMAKLLRTGET